MANLSEEDKSGSGIADGMVVDMLLTVKKGIKGGMCHKIHRRAQIIKGH